MYGVPGIRIGAHIAVGNESVLPWEKALISLVGPSPMESQEYSRTYANHVDGVAIRLSPEEMLDRIVFPITHWPGHIPDLSGEGKPPYWYHAGWLGVDMYAKLFAANDYWEYLWAEYRSGDTGGSDFYHSVPGVVNMVRAGPRVAAAGSRVTLRVVGGGFDAWDAAAAKVWLIKSDDTADPNVIGPFGHGEGNVVTRVVEFDPALVTRYRALEVEFDLADDVELGVYDVAVKVGSIEVAHGPEDHPWRGPENSLRIPRVMNVLKIELKEVSFTGTKYHVVAKDDGSGNYTDDPAANPHWQDNGSGLPGSSLDGDADDQGDHKYPVCYTRNTKMWASVKLLVYPAGVLPTPIQIRGDGPGNLDFPATTATVAGNEITVTNVECSNPFVNEVDFFDPMEVAWQLSWDGGTTWCDAGTSKNQVYVTLGDPVGGVTVFHSLAHLGCKNAHGESKPANCTAKIWNEFTDRDVRRVDGTQLTYYASYTCMNYSTASLLANGDGQCGAWAKLFIDVRKVQGLDEPNEYVIFTPTDDDGFAVKNWTFTGAGSSGHATHPYLNIPDSPLVGATAYNWRFAEVNDATGIPGQGNSNPASLFNNHQVVISGEYYDPSYGVKQATLQDIDDNAIDGFYIEQWFYPVDEPTVNLDLNGDGDKVDVGVNTDVMLFRKNPAGLNITETRYNY